MRSIGLKAATAAALVFTACGLVAAYAVPALARPPAGQQDRPPEFRSGRDTGWGGEQSPRRRHPRFEELDTDGDGVLSYEEASVILNANSMAFTESNIQRRGMQGQDGMRRSPAQRGFGPGNGRRGQDGFPSQGPEGRGHRPPRFEEMDANYDGGLSLEEALSIPHMDKDHFAELDSNGDDLLSRQELPPPPHHGGMGQGPNSSGGMGHESSFGGPRGGGRGQGPGFGGQCGGMCQNQGFAGPGGGIGHGPNPGGDMPPR